MEPAPIDPALLEPVLRPLGAARTLPGAAAARARGDHVAVLSAVARAYTTGELRP